jgi:crotonobetainyl-CoA:carnitine CoA-transferase CaiB-like acyl-CoA transferase
MFSSGFKPAFEASGETMEKSAFYKNARDDLPGPLAGVTVVEATTTWAGPMTGCVLADFGARVIKIEHPTGEVVRSLPPVLPDSDLTVPHETVNRNKLNVSLNLQHASGREAFLRLAETADVIVENFRPGTLQSWGVGYEDVAVVKPDIVYVSISGFGQFGLLSDRVGYDPIAQNYSGWASLNGDPDGTPMKAPTWLGDDVAGLHGALGAMAALRHRDQTGEGQHVDVSLVDALLFQSNGLPTAGALGLPNERWGNQFAIAAPVNNYKCKDGNVFAGVLLDAHWQRLARYLHREDLAGLTNAERVGKRREVDQLLEDYCASNTVDAVVNTFTEMGLPATRVNTYEEVAAEEHLASRDMLQQVTLVDGTRVPLVAPAVKFSRTPVRIRDPAAKLGQHNDIVLGELGYSSEELMEMSSKGAI